MKKSIAVLLIAIMLLSFASCNMVRKTTEAPVVTSEKKEENTGVPTFSEPDDSAAPSQNDNPKKVRYTEEEAYDVLCHSFPDQDMSLVEIERTKKIIAENDGTEYYIFNVSFPIIPETEAETESPAADGGDDGVTDTAEPEIEMTDPVPYYVSVNGVVHTEIAGSDKNITADEAEATFSGEYGAANAETGYAYKLVYEGTCEERDVEDNSHWCYSFAVYEVNTSGAEPADEYKFNYLVFLDGSSHGKKEIDH